LIAGATATTTAPPKTMASIAASLPTREGEYIHRAAWKAGVLGAVNVLVALVAVRLILLIAVIGAITLAWAVVPALIKATDPIAWPALIMLVVYGFLVVIPLVWLSSRR
jgi:hypothetical protein